MQGIIAHSKTRTSQLVMAQNESDRKPKDVRYHKVSKVYLSN